MEKDKRYRLLPELFLRAPHFSFAAYDPARLPVVLGDKVFRDAVFLASPEFYARLELKGFDWERLAERERQALQRYYNRMSFRPTPFGSFASFSLLRWGEDDGRTLLAPDVRLLLQPDEQLRQRQAAGKIGLNPLLYFLGKKYRFIRSVPDAGGKCRFSLEQIAAAPLYGRLFSLLKKESLDLEVLTNWVLQESACTTGEARAHIRFLLDQQVLVSEAAGDPIGPELLGFPARGFWEKGPGTNTLVRHAAELEQLIPPDLMAADRRYFYAAAERPWLSGGPSPDDRAELEKAIRLLQGLARPGQPAALSNFASAFKARFDLQKVALLLALDPDAGVAYEGRVHFAGEDGPVHTLRLPTRPAAATPLDWTDLHRLLFHTWQSRAGDPHAPLEIDPDKVAVASDAQFPNTTAVLFRHCGDRLLLEQAGGPSATTLLGRFSLFNPEVAALCRRLAALEAEANPGVVFADIGQFSDRHVDNINRRLPVYPFEIPLNVASSQARPAQLLPEDLLLSVRGSEIVLESRRLGKRVLPRLASAYNHQNNELGIFRLLCDLQYQGLHSALSFDLESFFPGMDFYPRVVSGRVILSLAKWKFSPAALAELSAETDELAALRRLRRFRGVHRLPDWVSMGHGDQQLVFELTDRDGSLFFLHCLRGMRDLTLLEYLPAGRSVKAGDKPLAGQFIGLLSHVQAVYEPVAAMAGAPRRNVQRRFSPGSNWLYLKLYCTPHTAVRVLEEVLRPLIRQFAGRIRCWFFIRFNDPADHLRLRFNVDGEDGGALLLGLCRQLEKSGLDSLLHTLVADTYQRELERYGPELIVSAETLFWRGSELVLYRDVERCTTFQLAFITALEMVLVCLPPAEAGRFANAQAEAFLREFGGDKTTRADLDDRFRTLRPSLSGIEKAPAMEHVLDALRDLHQAASGLPQARLRQLIGDVIHMQLNRTFAADQRKQELLVWYCLDKHLRSLNARRTGS